MNRWMSLVISIGGMAVAGCAYQPHEPIAIKPEIDLKPQDIGERREVQLVVVDVRKEKRRLGYGAAFIPGKDYKDAPFKGAEITVQENIKIPIHNAIADGMRRQGFTVAETATPEGRMLTVEILTLWHHKVVTSQVMGTTRVETLAELRASCFVGSGSPYEQKYRGFLEQPLGLWTEADDDRAVNSAVSKAVNGLLNDRALVNCVARPIR